MLKKPELLHCVVVIVFDSCTFKRMESRCRVWSLLSASTFLLFDTDILNRLQIVKTMVTKLPARMTFFCSPSVFHTWHIMVWSRNLQCNTLIAEQLHIMIIDECFTWCKMRYFTCDMTELKRRAFQHTINYLYLFKCQWDLRDKIIKQTMQTVICFKDMLQNAFMWEVF